MSLPSILICALATLLGLTATTMLTILFVAGMPNSSPQQLAFLTRCAWTTAILGLVLSLAGPVCLYLHRPRLGAALASLPTAALVLIMLYLTLSSLRR